MLAGFGKASFQPPVGLSGGLSSLLAGLRDGLSWERVRLGGGHFQPGDKNHRPSV